MAYSYRFSHLLAQDEAVVPLVRGRVLDEEAARRLVILQVRQAFGLAKVHPQRRVRGRFHDVLALEEPIKLRALPRQLRVALATGLTEELHDDLTAAPNRF